MIFAAGNLYLILKVAKSGYENLQYLAKHLTPNGIALVLDHYRQKRLFTVRLGHKGVKAKALEGVGAHAIGNFRIRHIH